jgi:ankyrin repeat protein
MSTAKGNEDNKDLLSTGKKEDAQRLSMVDQLFAACDSGDVNNASRLLAALPEVHLNTIKWSKDEGDLTLLTHAASNGHAEICQMLLDKGADVNQRSEGMVFDSGGSSVGITPLIYACQNGHLKVVNVLLAVDGIDVNYRKDNGSTALYTACYDGRSKVVEILLAVDGIRVNQAGNKEATPLSIACWNGDSKVVEMLLAVDGIQVNQATNKGWTPLNMACQNGHSKVVRMLLAVAGIQVNQANEHGWTPFISAVSKSHTALVILFLQHGIGHNNINEWFHVDKPSVAGRISLYKYAVLLPQQHQPLLDFHLCLLNTQNALVPTSSLKAFSRIWPQLVAFKIESFLLPTKQTRRTMQQVVPYFNETLNDINTYEETQLYEATQKADVDSVRFLVQQEGILLDQLSESTVEEEDEDDQLYETPLNCAVRFVEGDNDDAAAISNGIQIVELLREAGGTAREIPREEWLAEQNEEMETTPED